jgi:hypothetical protein
MPDNTAIDNEIDNALDTFAMDVDGEMSHELAKQYAKDFFKALIASEKIALLERLNKLAADCHFTGKEYEDHINAELKTLRGEK